MTFSIRCLLHPVSRSAIGVCAFLLCIKLICAVSRGGDFGCYCPTPQQSEEVASAGDDFLVDTDNNRSTDKAQRLTISFAS